MFKPEFITRHRDLVSPEQLAKSITVVGAGAIGSFTVLALAKMGFSNISVYDFDEVSTENIGNQFFPIDAVGVKKVAALQKMVELFSGIRINAVDKRIEKGDRLKSDIVICAVDSMEVRRMLLDCVNTMFIIDPRMGAEYATMETVDMRRLPSINNYKRTLFADSEAVQERCTAKTTIYTVLLIAGQVVKAVKDITHEFCGGDSQKYISSLDWNIAKNSMLAYSTKGERL